MGMSTILVLGGSNGKTLEKLAPKKRLSGYFP